MEEKEKKRWRAIVAATRRCGKEEEEKGEYDDKLQEDYHHERNALASSLPWLSSSSAAPASSSNSSASSSSGLIIPPSIAILMQQSYSTEAEQQVVLKSYEFLRSNGDDAKLMMRHASQLLLAIAGHAAQSIARSYTNDHEHDDESTIVFERAVMMIQELVDDADDMGIKGGVKIECKTVEEVMQLLNVEENFQDVINIFEKWNSITRGSRKSRSSSSSSSSSSSKPRTLICYEETILACSKMNKDLYLVQQ
eukprot:jgi/Bigna1/76959/fgenesh1_pg.45_\